MLYDKLLVDIKEAMKEKNESKKNVLRQVQSKAQMIAKENKSEDITDDMILKSIEKELKQLNQTKDSIKGHEDSPLYLDTEFKISVLKQYIPEKMSVEEVENILKYSIFTGMKMGDAMKLAKQMIGSKADSSVIASVVKRLIV